VDPATLTLGLNPATADRCLECKACVNHCPMGIDIRQGFQIECINCAQCLDSCRQVMARQGRPGLIGYFFSQEGQGVGALLNPRMAGLLLLTIALWSGLALALVKRPQANLKLARSATLGSRLLKDGQIATFFSGSLANRTGKERSFLLSVQLLNGEPLAIKGISDFQVASGAKIQVNLAVTSEPLTNNRRIVFSLHDHDGVLIQEIPAFLTPHKDSPP